MRLVAAYGAGNPMFSATEFAFAFINCVYIKVGNSQMYVNIVAVSAFKSLG